MNTQEILFLLITTVLCTVYGFVGDRGGKKSDSAFFGGIFAIFSILDIRHIWWSLSLGGVLGCAFWFFNRISTLFLWIGLNCAVGFFISASIMEKIAFTGLNARLYYSFPVLISILFALGSIRTWKKSGLKKMKSIFNASFSSLTFLFWGLFGTKNAGAFIQLIIVLYAMTLFASSYWAGNKEKRIEII